MRRVPHVVSIATIFQLHPLHHAHRSEFIGHVGSESEKCRFLDDLKERPPSLNSWNHYQQEQNEYIEEVKCNCGNEIHICIEVRWDVFLKHWKDNEIDHDTIEEEKGEYSRDGGKKGSEHRNE